jgi:hypothetical protein
MTSILAVAGKEPPMAIYPEVLWFASTRDPHASDLRYEPRIETALRELVSDAETRLGALEEQARAELTDTRLKRRLPLPKYS